MTTRPSNRGDLARLSRVFVLHKQHSARGAIVLTIRFNYPNFYSHGIFPNDIFFYAAAPPDWYDVQYLFAARMRGRAPQSACPTYSISVNFTVYRTTSTPVNLDRGR